MKLTVKKMGFLFLCAVAVPAAAEVDIGFTRMGFDEINSKRAALCFQYEGKAFEQGYFN